MAGGLPTFQEVGKKSGFGKDVVGILGRALPGEKKVSEHLVEMFAPPPPIEFPEVKPATPPPTISETQEAGDEAARKRRMGRGRRGTFLTGDVTPDLTPTKGKKKLLG